MNKDLDPITAEIIQNRLMQIGYEGGLVLQQCAVSPTVVEAKDLGFNVADSSGNTVVYSTWMPRHGTTLSYMLASCRERFGTQLAPGDMYLLNDPHLGALHSLDLAVIAPVFVRDELVAWVGNATHHTDIGAMAPGRSPLASDSYQEGIVFPPVRLVKQGTVDEEMIELFRANVRGGTSQVMDLRAQVSANVSAVEQIQKIVERYGTETFELACAQTIELSETAARKRIAMLTDGVYDCVEYLDYDRTYTLRGRLEVRGSALAFNVDGTDLQSGTFINAVWPCTVANVHNILACQLFPDLSITAGTFRPIEIDGPSGTVLSCTWPAPCSGASTIAGWKAQQLCLSLLTQALVGSELEYRAQAQWGWGFTEVQWSGADQAGRWFSMKGDSTLHGGGARAFSDGIDVANIAGSTNTSVPNVELYELRYPVLYLSRSVMPDSEGAGTFRGGFAGEWTRLLYGVKEAKSQAFYIGRDHGAVGVSGGQSGASARVSRKRGTNVMGLLKTRVPGFDDVEGVEETLPQQPGSSDEVVLAGDVIQVRGMGGGGFGDPALRDGSRMREDVDDGLISGDRARRVYGGDIGTSVRLTRFADHDGEI